MFEALKRAAASPDHDLEAGRFTFTDRMPIRMRMIIVGLVVSAAMAISGVLCFQAANRAAAKSFYLYDTIFHTVNYTRAAHRNLAQLNGYVVSLTLLHNRGADLDNAAQTELEERTRASLDEASRDWFDQYRANQPADAQRSIALFLLSEAEANLQIEETSDNTAVWPALPATLNETRQNLLAGLAALRPQLESMLSRANMSLAVDINGSLSQLSEEMEVFVQGVASEGYRRRVEADRLANTMGYVILAAILGTILISVLAAYAFAEDIRRRLLRLSDFARHVENGQLESTNHIEGRTELTTLMHGLDRMQKSIRGKMDQIDGLRREADDLLDMALPPQIVKRLRQGESRIADAKAEATIVFIDLTGFTELTRRFGAAHLIDTLDDIFLRLDEAAERNRIEKIKTIGDAYMAAAGVTSETQADDAIRCARFAIEAHEAIQQVAKTIGYPLNASTGLHNGAVVAGILGKSNLDFDVWGDAVNLAARLQSSAEPGEIRVSEAAYWRLHQEFDLTALGEIQLKGMGAIKAFVLKHPASS